MELDTHAAREAPIGSAVADAGGEESADAAGFAALRVAFRASGGLARGDDIALLLADRGRGDYVSLARLIGAGEVFGFEWQRSFWIPMFQFDPRDLSIRPGSRQVLAELASAFDGWRLATWFTEPNAWLDAARPIDLIDVDPAEVVQAARADRFVVAG